MSEISPFFPKSADRKHLQIYLRLLLSYSDFKNAYHIAQAIVEEHRLLAERGGDDVIMRALHCSVVVSYARPFNSSGRSRLGRVRALGKEFRGTLKDDESKLHDYILFCRNKMIAHSDAEVADPVPFVASDLGGKLVIPERNDSLAPFNAETSVRVCVLLEKAKLWCMIERQRWEPKILHLLDRRPFLLK